MTKVEYIQKLAELYSIANKSDHDDNPNKWLPVDACATHCQAFDRILEDLCPDPEDRKATLDSIWSLSK